MKMVCHSGSSETLHGQLQTALQRQAWAAAPPGLLQMLAPVPQLAAAEGGAVLGRVGPGSGLAAGSASDFQPSRAIVEGLVAIGYPRLHAMNASAATRNAGVQAAVNWLCDNEGSPALDQPSPYLQADGSSASPAQPSSSSSYPPPAPPGPLASGGVMAGPAGGGGGGESFANPLLQAQAGSSGSSLSSSGLGPAVARTTSARGVGVSGILKQEEMRAARTDA